MNNPFDYTPDTECDEAFRELTRRIESLRLSHRPEDVNFIRELDAGKMLGVLIAEDKEGMRDGLYAFSGQLGDGGFHHEGFVGPVFDYLKPDGHFKTKEAGISDLNAEISRFENGAYANAKAEYERAKELLGAEVEEYREKCRISKAGRDAKRKSGCVSEAEAAEMIRQSQFEKAELRRIKKRAEAELEPFKADMEEASVRLDGMKERRRSDSEALQKWLFDNFRLLNARGESRSLSEIFAETSIGIPPSGAGECCAPKLLQTAYLKGWTPVSIAEYWYGAPKRGEVRVHGRHYPACRGKCLPVLRWMLQGLTVEPPLGCESWTHDADGAVSMNDSAPRIIYENQWFCIIDKPSGMLSVPGKGDAMSVQRWLEERYGPEKGVKVAHRLDQDTSGLLVATFGELSFKVMQACFATRAVKKTYVAMLEGDWKEHGLPQKGRIDLPLSPDWLDRPRQRVDFDKGKEAVTDYEFTDVAEGRSRVTFHPHTGRTHQLRVHAASGKGLGMPIAGDRLYGADAAKPSPRLLLHAHRIEFTFPLDSRPCSFESPVPF